MIITIGGVCRPQSTTLIKTYRGGNIMLWGCSATGGTGAPHKIDGIRKEDSATILKQHFQTSAKQLRLDCGKGFPIDSFQAQLQISCKVA